MRRTIASWSIAIRLVLPFAGFSLAILVGVGLVLYLVLERDLYRDEAHTLELQTEAVRKILELDPDLTGPPSEGLRYQSPMTEESDYGLRVTDEAGREIFETPGLADRVPYELLRHQDPSVPASEVSISRLRRDGQTYLIAVSTVPLDDRGMRRRVTYVSYDGWSDEEVILAHYRVATFSLIFFGWALSVGMAAWVARSGLRPLQEIAAVARRITAERLDERIGERPWPKELAALATAFDEMLARLAVAVSRLSQFSADLAHELRTPLSNLIGETEVTLSRSRSESEYRETLESSLEEYRRIARLAEELLFIARLESEAGSAEFQPIEARDVAEAVKGIFESVAEEQGATIEVEGSARLVASPSLLQRALINLVSNAIAHAAPKRIAIELERTAEGTEIRVRDDGCGIAADHTSRIFDRFYRVDSSRVRDLGGAGLGLAIVKSVVELHRGRVDVHSALGIGTCIVLTIPDR